MPPKKIYDAEIYAARRDIEAREAQTRKENESC